MTADSIDSILNEYLFPGNAAAFNDLADFVRSGQIIAFTGAGVSVPTFPTWSTLLSNLLTEAASRGLVKNVKEIESELSNDPLELASTLEEAFTRNVFRSRLGKLFAGAAVTATDCQIAISHMRLRGIVTLNYDSGHEAAFSQKGELANMGRSQDEAVLTRWMQGDVFDGPQVPLLHLHGEASNPEHMIFTSDDYNRFYSATLAESMVTQLWRSNRLLVIGFGFSDPFLTRMAEGVLRALQSDLRHYALIGRRTREPVSELQRRIFAKKFRLTPIYYEVRELTDADGKAFEDHSDLAKLIRRLPTTATTAADTVSKATKSSGELVVNSSAVISPDVQGSVQEFERDLFVSPLGGVLYASPRLIVQPKSGGLSRIDQEEIVELMEVVGDSASYFIAAQPEYGATTFAKRLLSEFSAISETAYLKDASLLPNYKRKLQEGFEKEGVRVDMQAILILDNFDLTRDERLLKEVIGLGLFRRVLVLARISFFEASHSIPIDQFALPFKLVTLAPLHRADIRKLTSQFYETSDEDTVSATVDKIYSDLLDLCIPITPSNVIMYLTILYKEGDFNPINRVQIVGRYLDQLLRRPSDAFRDAFTSKNKMAVLAAFVFRMFSQKKETYTEADWSLFCREHMQSTLTLFDERLLLSELIASKVLVRFGPYIAFKYRFFHVFFLGSHVANRPPLLEGLMKGSSYLSHEGLVEVISELASDNSGLVSDIVENLDKALAEFSESYVPESFDPFSQIEWPVDAKEEEKIWKPLTKMVADGPRNVDEIDQIKRSIVGEQRATNQQIVVQKFDHLERRVVMFHEALVDALGNSDNLDGELKKQATVSVLRAYFRIYQVGLLLSPALASKRYFLWHGILFLNRIDLDDLAEDKKISAIMNGMQRAVVARAADKIGSRKLGEVFKVLARDEEIGAFLNQMNFACLLRAKPKDWVKAASDIVANTGAKEFYLRAMLYSTIDQYRDEVNTAGDREQLKKLIATIRIKRDLKKDRPGEGMLAKIMGKLEKQNYFANIMGQSADKKLDEGDDGK
jgi:hypothetical protein